MGYIIKDSADGTSRIVEDESGALIAVFRDEFGAKAFVALREAWPALEAWVDLMRRNGTLTPSFALGATPGAILEKIWLTANEPLDPLHPPKGWPDMSEEEKRRRYEGFTSPLTDLTDEERVEMSEAVLNRKVLHDLWNRVNALEAKVKADLAHPMMAVKDDGSVKKVPEPPQLPDNPFAFDRPALKVGDTIRLEPIPDVDLSTTHCHRNKNGILVIEKDFDPKNPDDVLKLKKYLKDHPFDDLPPQSEEGHAE